MTTLPLLQTPAPPPAEQPEPDSSALSAAATRLRRHHPSPLISPLALAHNLAHSRGITALDTQLRAHTAPDSPPAPHSIPRTAPTTPRCGPCSLGDGISLPFPLLTAIWHNGLLAIPSMPLACPHLRDFGPAYPSARNAVPPAPFHPQGSLCCALVKRPIRGAFGLAPPSLPGTFIWFQFSPNHLKSDHYKRVHLI